MVKFWVAFKVASKTSEGLVQNKFQGQLLSPTLNNIYLVTQLQYDIRCTKSEHEMNSALLITSFIKG